MLKLKISSQDSKIKSVIKLIKNSDIKSKFGKRKTTLKAESFSDKRIILKIMKIVEGYELY